MTYDVDFELAALIFAIILYVFLTVQYSNNAPVNRQFKRMILYLILTNLADVASAVTINYYTQVPIWVNVAMSTAYFCMAGNLGYQFLKYTIAFLFLGKTNRTGQKVAKAILGIYMILLVINLFTGVIFSFNYEEGYLHGPLYYIAYSVSFYFIIHSMILTFINFKMYNVKQKVSVVVFFAFCTIGPTIQMVFLPNILLSYFTITVGALIMMFSLETPDYQHLINTTQTLEKTKEEAEKAKEMAIAANNAKTEFLGNMSHELKTPINAVIGYNEMIIRENVGEDVTEYARSASAAGKNLLAIVNDILDFSLLDSGKIRIDDKPFEVTAMLQDIVVYAKYATTAKRLDFELEIDEKLPNMLKGDYIKLSQIINNLISNAVKYTNKGRIKLSVKAERVENRKCAITFGVEDTGIGMKKEDIEKVLEAFARVDIEKNRNVQGLGLGLSIVTALLQLMGSKLHIESTYGKGSLFYFVVEQGIEDETPIGDFGKRCEQMLLDKVQVTRFTAPNAKILVVDDNIINLELFKGIMKETKIQIDTALDGKGALEMLSEGSYDIVFLDHMMPEMDGFETLELIKKRKLCPGVPIVAFTANTIAGQKEMYLSRGFDEYLSKPIVIEDLMSMVKQYVPEELINTLPQENASVKEGISVPTEQIRESFMDRLTFIDAKLGLEYCGDDEDFYREILKSYTENTNLEEIDRLYREENWGEYGIQVHGLKSTSLSIGAVELSQDAKVVEMAVKAGEMDTVREKHSALLEKTKQLSERLISALEGKVATVNESTSRKKPLILVADDNLINLKIAESILQKFYDVDTVSGGVEVFNYLKKKTPDLMLIDLNMPDVDGFVVLRNLKQDEKYADIPVIILTSDEDRKIQVDGYKMGVYDFIIKPFIADILVNRVNAVLELRRLQIYERNSQNLVKE